MLINSLEFLLIFCPIVYAGYFFLAHYSTSRIALVDSRPLLSVSTHIGIFTLCPVLCLSIAFNYAVVEAIKTLRAILHWKRGYVLCSRPFTRSVVSVLRGGESGVIWNRGFALLPGRCGDYLDIGAAGS